MERNDAGSLPCSGSTELRRKCDPALYNQGGREDEERTLLPCVLFQKHQFPTPSQILVPGSPLAYLTQPGSPALGTHIHHVDAGGNERGKNQLGPLHAGIVKAGAASAPTRGMQLVFEVGHGQAVDHLGSQGRVRVAQGAGTNGHPNAAHTCVLGAST